MALDHPRWAGLPNHLPYPSGRAERPRTCQPRASRAKQRMAGRLCHLGMINCSSNGVKSDGKGWKRRFIPPETPFEVSHAGNLTHVFFGAFWIFLGSHGEPIFRQTPFSFSHSLESHKCAGNWGECIMYIFSDATIFRLSGRQRAHKSLVILCEVQWSVKHINASILRDFIGI